jgi:hypothetical protein
MTMTHDRSGTSGDIAVPDDGRTYLLNHISWGAVFAGIATALVFQLLINMLGLGIGMASFNVGNSGDNPAASTFSIGAAIWWTVSGILASLSGGIVAGRLCGSGQVNASRWHGFVSWCGATLIIFYLLTSTIGSILGGTFSALGSTISGAGKTAASAVTGLAGSGDGGGLDGQIKSMINPSDAQNAQSSLMAYVRASASGDPQAQQAARDKAVNDLAHAANITPDDARTRLDQLQQQYRQTLEQAKQQATQAAEVARKSASQAAIFGFVALALGAVAAWFGGGIGAARREAALLPGSTATAGITPASRRV